MTDNNVLMENAQIIFRNFAGKEGKFNREGDRNFSVILDQDTALAMAQDGWNVRWLNPREAEEQGDPYLQVTVGFKGRPPKIVMITSRGRTNLSEEEVELLDWADIRTADLIVRPYNWAVSDKTGVKAYLKSLFVTIDEDELELKYSAIDETNPVGHQEP